MQVHHRRRHRRAQRSYSDSRSPTPSARGPRNRSRGRGPQARGGGAGGVNSIPLGERRDGPREPREDESTMRVWVHHRDCATIIGKGGRTMRDMEARSRAKLKVQREEEMDSDTKERHVDIIGTQAEQKAALDILIELASFCRENDGKVLKDTRRPVEPGDAEAPGPKIIEMLTEEVGRLLGRKGETIKNIERDSGAKIELDKASGRVEMHGTVQAQERALAGILDEVTYAKVAGEDGAILKDTPRPKASPDETDNQPPLKFWVRDREAGRVIGRGGETVREVMEKSGAEVKVQKMEDMRHGSSKREIKLFGAKEQRDKALELILLEVTWAEGEDGILKGGVEEESDAKKQANEEKVEATPDPSKENQGADGPIKENQDAGGPPEENQGADRALEDEKPPAKSDGDAGGSSVPEKHEKITRHERHERRERSPSRRREHRTSGNRVHAGHGHGPKDPPGSKRGSGTWVCSTCGGDHRTKECPHAVGVGMQIGMQMGMQALGMQMGMGPLGPMPMPPGHVPPMVPPMVPGLMGLPPGMPPMLPGFMGMHGAGRSSSRSSEYTSSSEESGSSDVGGGGPRGRGGACRQGSQSRSQSPRRGGARDGPGLRRRRRTRDVGERRDGRRGRARPRGPVDVPPTTKRRRKGERTGRVDVADL